MEDSGDTLRAVMLANITNRKSGVYSKMAATTEELALMVGVAMLSDTSSGRQGMLVGENCSAEGGTE